jgi:hypothetical protein
VAILALLPVRAADADNPLPASRGFEGGLTLGIAHPGGPLGAGPVGTTPSVSGVAATWIPIGVQGGYRLSPGVYFGAALDWGAVVGDLDGCPACNFRYDLQGRAEARLYALPRSTFDPWLAFGFGFEVLHLSLGEGSPGASATYVAPILAHVELGLDVRSRAVAVGPYFGFSVSEFLTRSLDPPPPGESSSIGAPEVHEWFRLGVRGTYGPW